MLTLAIGDLFIPDRSIDIPTKFGKLLSPNPQSVPSNPKINQVICLGNITNDLDTLKLLYNISPNFNLVRGEFDDVNLLSQQLSQLTHKPLEIIQNYKVLKVDNLKIGFTNGSLIVPKNDPLSLSTLARELDVDILIYGGTHKVDAYVLDGKFFVNPGSATGAFNFDWQPEDEDEEDDDNDDDDGNDDDDEEQKKDEQEVVDVEGKDNEQEEVQQTADEEENKGPTTDKLNEEINEETSKPTTQGDHEINETNDHSKDTIPEITEKLASTTINDELTKEELHTINNFTNIPSFCLLETHNNTCTLYIYTYLDDEVKVDKVTYHKE